MQRRQSRQLKTQLKVKNVLRQLDGPISAIRYPRRKMSAFLGRLLTP